MNEKQITETIQRLALLNDMGYDSIARTQALGENFDFKQVAEKHLILKKFLTLINEKVLKAIPDSQSNHVHGTIGKLHNALETIINSDPEILRQNRENYIIEYDSHYSEVFLIMGWFYPLIQIFSPEIEKTKDRMDNFFREMGEQKKEAEKQKKEFGEIIEAARKISGESGVGKEAVYFKTIKDNHKASAKWWLVTTVVLVASLAAYGVHLIESAPSLEGLKEVKNVQWPVLIQTLFGKAILIGVLGYAIRLCSKNYLANRHNAVIAEHRQTSLSTYRAIVEAAGEQANRDIILLKAADSIFGQHITGFLKENDSGNSSNSPVNLRVNSRMDTTESS